MVNDSRLATMTYPRHALTFASDWHYMAEGGSRVVLCYRGPDPSLVGKVLRVRKRAKDRPLQNLTKTVDNEQDHRHDLTDLELWVEFFSLERQDQDELAEIFSDKLLRPFLSRNQTDTGVRIRVDASFLTQVATNIASFRPAKRWESSVVDVKSRSAVIVQNHRNIVKDDYSTAQVISLEIKPKCGFADPMNRAGIARFRMHQSVKLAGGKLLRTSNYDPLDLYGELDEKIYTDTCLRMHMARQGSPQHAQHRRAMLALIQEPQNNFLVTRPNDLDGTNFSTHLFNDPKYPGSMNPRPCKERNVYTHRDAECISIKPHGFRSFGIWQLSGFLGRRMPGEQENALHKNGSVVDNFIDVALMALSCTGVLSRIRAAQRLDRVGIEGAMRLVARIRQMKQIPTSVTGIENHHEISMWGSVSKVDRVEFAYHLLRNFIISATAKDCSIILSINRLNTMASGVPVKLRHDSRKVLIKSPVFRVQRRTVRETTEEHVKFLCQVAVVDQDMKLVSKSRYWLALDRKIRGHYATNGLFRWTH